MKRIWSWFLGQTRGKQIVVAVCFVHVFVVAVFFASHSVSYLRRSPAKIIVRSVVQKKEALAVVKPSKASASVTKRTSPKKGTLLPERPKSSLPRDTVLDDALDALLSHSPVEKRARETSLVVPKAPVVITALVVDDDAPSSSTYAEELIAFLQSHLDLPEYGDVTMRLTIDRWGSVQSCEVIASKSDKNSAFLKKRLPELSLPCLNGPGFHDATYTIVFRNLSATDALR
ncbi:MAG: hypothetical protein RL235_336 [Chlamydiota bacterium]